MTLSALLHRIVFILLEQKTQMSWRSMYNKDFCGTVMPSKKDKMVEFSQYIKSDKMPYTIYADIESLINKIDGCTNNPKNSSTTKSIFLVDIQYQQFGHYIT